MYVCLQLSGERKPHAPDVKIISFYNKITPVLSKYHITGIKKVVVNVRRM